MPLLATHVLNPSLHTMGRSYGCLINFMRAFLIVYNILFLFVGIAFMAVGVLMVTQYRGYTRSLGPDLSVIPMLLVVLGVVLILLCGMGIAGGAFTHGCLLFCYSGLLLLLMCGELALAIVTVTVQDDVQKKAKTQIIRAMSYYSERKTTQFGIDLIQQKFNCCGITSYRDWKHALNREMVPRSCCLNETACNPQYVSRDRSNWTPPGVRKMGCMKALAAWIRTHNSVIIGVLSGSCVLELAGMLFGFILAYRLRKLISTEMAK
ncbi:unnamed protein product [Dicrocoelium dendriticum]|nr:unnamed protein product [Dicrocoelium dendriticum]